MTVPFMKAYSDLVVKTCHARGAHAMGGMAAVIPSRTDEEANQKAFEAVRADKEREASAASTGPGSRIPTPCRSRRRRSTRCSATGPTRWTGSATTCRRRADALLDVASTPGDRTEEGLRSNVNVGIQYISSWLRGNGAAGIYGLMEDAATAEIARGQVWQWIRHERDPGRRPHDHARPRARAGDLRAGANPRPRSATTSGSRGRAGRTCRARCSSESH